MKYRLTTIVFLVLIISLSIISTILATTTTSYNGMYDGTDTIQLDTNTQYATYAPYPQTQSLARLLYGVGDTTASSNGTDIFTFGGETVFMATISPYVQIFHSSNNTVSLGTNMPTPRWCSGVTYYNGEFYVAGGEAGIAHGDSLSRKLEVYSPVTNSWRTMNDIPVGINGPCMITHNPTTGLMYLYHRDVLYELDPAGDGGMGTYTLRAAAPAKKEYGVWTYLQVGGQNRVYNLGGLNTDTITSTNTVYYYNIDSNNWSSAQSPAPWVATAPATSQSLFNGLIYYAGGSNIGVGDVNGQIVAYNPVGNNWTGTLAYFPATMDGRGCGIIGSDLIFTGGWMGNQGYSYIDKYVLTGNPAVNGTLNAISLQIASGSVGSARLGVYDNNSGIPGNLILDAGTVVLSEGWNTTNLTTSLSPGVYWLVVNMQSTNAGVRGQNTDAGFWSPTYFKAHAYGPLDAAWGAAGTNWAKYVQIRGTFTVTTPDPPSLPTLPGAVSSAPLQSLLYLAVPALVVGIGCILVLSSVGEIGMVAVILAAILIIVLTTFMQPLLSLIQQI